MRAAVAKGQGIKSEVFFEENIISLSHFLTCTKMQLGRDPRHATCNCRTPYVAPELVVQMQCRYRHHFAEYHCSGSVYGVLQVCW